MGLSRRLRVPRRAAPAWLQPLVVAGIACAGAWLLVAVLAPWLAPYDPLDQGGRLYQPPSAEHLFGTDDLGRDVFSRVLWVARVSIPLAVLLVSLAFLIGGTLGALAGYLGGWVDEVVMRAADLVFAIPTILLAMAVVAALGPGLLHAVLAVVVVSWPGHARVVRSLVRTTMQSDYVVLDEPLSALDASVQAQVANLLVELARDLGMGMLLISHDLGIVRHVAHRTAVMYLGLIVETAPTDQLWQAPKHPYTTALIGAIPHPDGAGHLPEALTGEIPDPARPPRGCRFHPRCPYAFDRCPVEPPPLLPVGSERDVACWLHAPAPASASASSAPAPAAGTTV